jgi:hypothetical protein
MKNRRNLIVVAIATAVVGLCAGVGSLQYDAQLVSDSGVHPNIAKEGTRNVRTARTRIHSFWNTLRGTPVERATTNDQTHSSAKDLPTAEPGCEGTTGQRLTKCNAGMKVLNETAQ